MPVAARPLPRRIVQSSTQIFHEGSRMMNNENIQEIIVFRNGIQTWQEPTCLRGKELRYARSGMDQKRIKWHRFLICKDLMPITDVCHASCQHIFFQLQGAVSSSSITKRASLFWRASGILLTNAYKHYNSCVLRWRVIWRCCWHPVMLLGHGRWWSLWLYNPHGFLQQNCYCR